MKLLTFIRGLVLPPEVVEPAPACPTVADFADAWEQRRSTNPRIRAATKRNNLSHLECHIKPRLGPLLLCDLTPHDARDWVVLLRDDLRPKAGEKYAPYSVRNAYSTAKKMFDHAMSDGHITANPFRSPIVTEELPAAGRRHDAIVLVPRESCGPLFRVAPAERRIRYMLGILGGLRDGEASGLSWSRTLLDDAVPHAVVDRQLNPSGAFGPPKTKSGKRAVPLHPMLLSELKSYRATVGTVDPESALLPDKRGRYARPRSAELLRRDLKAAGMSDKHKGIKITAHSTRRSFATFAKDAGVSEGDRRMIMGHAAGNVTDGHYTERELESLAKAVAMIEIEPGAAT